MTHQHQWAYLEPHPSGGYIVPAWMAVHHNLPSKHRVRCSECGAYPVPPRQQRLGVSLPDDLVAWVRQMAEREEATVSAVVEASIRKYRDAEG